MKDVYVIECYSLISKSMKVSSECYTNKENAIKFCRDRLNEEENALHDKALARNLINWYEFASKTYIYKINVLSMK